MRVSIFGFTTTLESIIIIFLLLCLVWGNTARSCSRVGLLEGLEMMTKPKKGTGGGDGGGGGMNGAQPPSSSSSSQTSAEPFMNYTNDDTKYGTSLSEANKPIDLSKWGMQVAKKGDDSNANTGNSANFFEHTKFSHKCCPSPYSNSMGCACMSDAQYTKLNGN